MRLSRFATCFAAIALLLGIPAFAQAKAHRVLFALTSSDTADWNLTLGNVHNLMAGVAPDEIQVEIVAYGPGILFLKNDGPVAAELKELQTAHVHLVACGNAMRARHLTPADLIPGAEVVPAGIVEVVRKQEEGWTYIKAGR